MGRIAHLIPFRVRHALHGILRLFRFAGTLGRNGLLQLQRRPDYRRWSNPARLETWWDERTSIIAEMVPAGGRVIEFGAGRRQLEKLLPAGCTYTPSDLVDRGPDTIVCDLNNRPLPDLRSVGVDIAVFGGVLEYVRDVPSLALWLRAMNVHVCILSFDSLPADLDALGTAGATIRRSCFGYMNNMTEEQLLRAFETAGMQCVEKRIWTTQGIYRFVRQT